jgi:hypothetical protein
MQTPAQPAAPKTRPAPPVPPPEFQSEKIDSMSSTELAAVLRNSRASTFEKAKACQRLASVGTKEAVPAMAALLPDAQLSHYARYGLEPNPDASADDALREALPKVRGKLLVGVINSIGTRKDPKAAPALARLLADSDSEVAQAAAAALGKISGPESTKALQRALGRTQGPMRMAIAGACLVCAEGLLARGDRAQAFAVYNTLTAPDVPKPVRLAAMRGIIAAETSLSRPR